jgi:hypothetical protein
VKINRDAVDGRFKLRYPSKIAVDMSTGLLDKKKENHFILEVL